MELITGGKYQGKREYAVNVLKIPEENIIDDFNEKVREFVYNKEDARAYVEHIIKNMPDAVVLADEAGCGIIPVDENEREYRMVLGRLVCALSEKADHVYRVVAGLGIRLK